MELFKDFKDLWRGVALTLVISVPAWLLGRRFEVIGGPVFAILIGMVMGHVLRKRSGVAEAAAPGIKYTSKKILQYAVILLGFDSIWGRSPRWAPARCPSLSPPSRPRS